MKTSKTLSLSWQNKLISTALASVSLFLGAPQLALATLPSTAASNLTVIAGTVPTPNITTTGANTTSSINSLTIQPTSANTVLNWNNFSDGTTPGGLLGSNDTVTFQLPTTSSGVLNNIAGLNPTVLAGNIRSNGNVFFLNPAGIVVTSQAQINVGGFYASTVPDSNAISYFYNNGTLGVFAGLSQNLTNAASQSGVIYIQSGATIVTNNSSAGVNLASAYVGASGVNFAVGSFGMAATSMNTAASTVTLNTGSAVASTGSVGAVQVDSTNVNGNLTIISLGGSAGSNVGVGLPGNSTIVTSGYNPSGAIAGGSMSITTNGGAVTLNGSVSTAGNIVVNTIGSYNGGAVTLNGTNIVGGSNYTIAAGGLMSVSANGNIISQNTSLTSGGNMSLSNSGSVQAYVISLNNANSSGTLTLTTNNGAITNPVAGTGVVTPSTGVVSTGAVTISTGVNAGAGGNITLNGQLPSGSITGSTVTITDSGAATYASVTAGGSAGVAATSSSITTTGNGNLTITQLTSNGSFSAISNRGNATIGSTSSTAVLSTINGTATVTGNTGAFLYTANVYNNPTLNIPGKVIATTENTSTAVNSALGTNPTYSTSATVGLVNVTVNGDIQAFAKTVGTVNLTTVTENSPVWTTINATTAAGAINLTSISTTNGQITANSQSGYGAATGGYTLSLSTINNQTANSNANSGVSYAQSFDTYSTANGSITVSGLVTKNTDVIIAANATGNTGGLTQNASGILLFGAAYSASVSGTITSNTTNANLMAVGNVTTPTGSIASSINYVGTNPSSALTVTTANGYINLSNISISSGNTVSLTVPTLNNQVTFKANSDLTVSLNISGQTLNSTSAIASTAGTRLSVAGQSGIVPDTQANTPVYLSATGNLAVTSVNSWGVAYPIQLIAPQITLSATNNITSSIAVDTTAYKTSFITIQTANTLNLSNINNATGVTGGTIAALTATGTATPNTLTLTSTSGNVNLDSALGASIIGVNNANTNPALTVIANTGNINVSAIVTSNTTSLTAGTGIANYTPSLSATGTLIIANNNTLTVNAPQVNLGTNSTSITASNQIPNLIATGGANGITINSGGGTSGYTTLNINTGTNVAGNLTITTNTQGVNIGLNSADTIQVLGSTVINTANTITSTGAILSNASSPNLFGNVSLTANNNTIQLGASNSASNYGQISASAGSGSITINEGGVTNLGNVTTTGTLIVNASGIVNNSGTVTAATANLSTGTALAPGSIAIGQVANPAAITNVNVLNAGTLSYNSGTSATTITANGQNIATLVLVGGGNLNYYQTGGSVGTVTDTVSGSGTLVYGLTNAQTTAATLTNLGTGSMQVTANGTGSLGALTLNFGGTGTASLLSTITNNSSWTVSNVTSGSNFAGDVTFNAAATSSSKNNLTIGSNVVLPGSGKITFTTGNLNYGTVADTAGSAMTLNATQGSAAFTGNNISISNASNVMGTIAFTSNGNVSYTNNGNIILAASSLGATASGANTIQSVTGNISQTGVLTVLGVNTPISFLASTTNNNGVMLTQTNLVNGSAKNTISITGSGNSAYYSGNTTAIYLGTVNIGYNTSPAGSQFTACATSTANINETSGIYVWGNTSLIATGGNVVMTAAGNNFGAITATATSTGNISITEAATSSYLQVTTGSGNFTAQSVSGDIITATQTNNSAIAVGGNSNINAAGQISLTNSGDKFNGVGFSTTLTSGSNATLLGTQSASNAYLVIGNGTNVKGNLSVTNTYSGGQINDQGSTSGITVNGTSAFLETGLNGSSVANGQVNLTGQNNVFTGGLSIQGFIANIYTLGNLIILPVSNVTNANYTSLNGNISTAGTGGSYFGTLNLNAPFGSITVNNSLIINVGMTLTGTSADLSFLSLANDLKGNSPNRTGITGVYKPPVP